MVPVCYPVKSCDNLPIQRTETSASRRNQAMRSGFLAINQVTRSARRHVSAAHRVLSKSPMPPAPVGARIS